MCSSVNVNLFTMAPMDRWDNACRLCSEEKNEMLPIFGDEGMQRRVVHKLRACLPVLVYKTDPLPKQICQFCAARLDDAYQFREYCLNIYRNMHAVLLRYKKIESVQTFFNAMKNSPDPCQSQLCKEKSRAPPPLVPLSIAMSLDESVNSVNQITQHQLQSTGMEALSELPCEVEIKEMNADTILNTETAVYEPPRKKLKYLETLDIGLQPNTETVSISDTEEETVSKAEHSAKKEEKRTSILEQVLTGNLTMNNHQKLQPKTKLTSEWWCAPCNNYYKTKDSLMKHMQLDCPRVYTCRTCSLSFDSVEGLAKHEASNHLQVKVDFVGNLKDCHQCDRQFASWEMLRQHRLRDHIAELTEIGTNTRCSLCNRFFPTVESYKSHKQLHQINENLVSQKLQSAESAFSSTSKIAENPKEGKREEHFYENVKSLTCPTCGKVCTQQSALSNHMRTHEPKRHKCEICGRTFGLFIRLAAHRMAEHNQQPTMSAIEQEEALNAEREAREARNRGIKNKSYPELIEKNDILTEDESLKRNSKNVARCGICLQWFSDHTTMLTHLQTHSDTYSHKNFSCHICKKSFKDHSQLLRHEVCHNKRSSLDYVPLYTPNVGNKSLTDKTHQTTHTVDKTYHCAKCNKIFFKEMSFLAHQCTGEPPHANIATAKSVQKTSSHSNNKRYKCSKCEASFLTSQSRNAHMRIHVDNSHGNTTQTPEIKIETDDQEMPKLCPETLVEYNVTPIEPKIEINEQSTPPPLKRTLIKTASGYRCGVCQSPFVSRELAVAHLRSAHPMIPYQCPYCKKRFTTQYIFTHHIKTEHPDEPEK